MERKLLMYIFGNTDEINEYLNKKLFEYQKLYKRNLIGTSGFNKSYDIYNSNPEIRIKFYKSLLDSLLENHDKTTNQTKFDYLYEYNRYLDILRERGPNDQLYIFKDDFVKEKPIYLDYIYYNISETNDAFGCRFCSIYDNYSYTLRILNEFILNGDFEYCINLIHIVNKYKILMNTMMKFTPDQIRKYSINNRYRSDINFILSLIEYVVERNLI